MKMWRDVGYLYETHQRDISLLNNSPFKDRQQSVGTSV